MLKGVVPSNVGGFNLIPGTDCVICAVGPLILMSVIPFLWIQSVS